MSIGHILHATDFSSSADSATEQTRVLAKLFGARVTLMHKVVYPAPHPPTEVLNNLGDSAQFDRIVREMMVTPIEEAQKRLDAISSELRASGVAVAPHLIKSGEPVEELLRLADEIQPDLIVVGTHGRQGLNRAFLGSVAEKTIRHAPCPVLTVREGAQLVGRDGDIGHALVPVDFSESSRQALTLAKSLSVDHGGRLTVQHVIEHGAKPWERESSFEERAEKAKAAIDEELAGHAAEKRVVSGRAVDAILEAANAESVDWIVMGTRGHSGLTHLLAGSVAERVTRFAGCPVLTVHDERQRERKDEPTPWLQTLLAT